MPFFEWFAFNYSVILVCQIISDYGFNLVGSRRVALGKLNSGRGFLYFASVQHVRLLLAILTFGIFHIVTSNGVVNPGSEIYTFMIFMPVIGSALTPTWYFMGAELYGVNVVFNMIPRVLLIFSSYLLVGFNPDPKLSLAIFSFFGIMPGLISLIYIYLKFGRDAWVVRFRFMKAVILSGFHNFYSGMISTVYTSGPMMLLGVYGTPGDVGVYASSERLVKAAQYLLSPIAQVIYPIAVKKHEDTGDSRRFFLSVGVFYSLAGLFVTLFFYFFSDRLLQAMYGTWQGDIYIPKLMSFFPLIFSISLFVSQVLCVAAGRFKVVGRAYTYGALLFLLLIYPSIIKCGAIGAVACSLVVEVFVIFLLIFLGKRAS